MDTVNAWTDLTFQSLRAMGEKVMTVIPNILGAIIILIIGWIITKIVVIIVKKALKLFKLDSLTNKLSELKIFGESNIKFNVTNAIVLFVKWILFLVFLIIASDIMNWTIVSHEIGNLLSYLPKLFSAIALFMIGIYIAQFIRKAILGLYDSFALAGGKVISGLVFYLIAVLITITALNQAGINTTVITNNISIILGALLLAVAIGFGLGSKEIIRDLLRTFYVKKTYEIGDKIKINGMEGSIDAIDNTYLTLDTEKSKIFIPVKGLDKSIIEVSKK